jgi:hypothetical protein
VLNYSFGVQQGGVSSCIKPSLIWEGGEEKKALGREERF